ncbi:uncharacterized protein LOC115964624 [Quercus lobata]|uniref:uncharacterized protein LOC115964624 n=1 Tax=Quercus lobata TaxID=97700 RepID=UPI0012467ED2|nr:uncharacterized protein LOC115964624 [Quercus lobata]
MNRKDIGKYFSTKFLEVFQSSSPSVPPNLDELIEPSISTQENEMLTDVQSTDDIRRVMFEMQPFKALVPDGMSGLFYRHYWSIVGDQLVAAVQSFFREGWLLRELNHTYITLILKVQGAYNFNQFKPISLCNVCYKVILKIIVSRLRPLLNKMIDPTQVTFIPDRNIAKNMILAQEIVHNFRTMRKKKGCIASYTLLINGSHEAKINPSRGLRQGDPLSPHLFITGCEVLARLISRKENKGNIRGVHLANGAPAITKLFYADDVMLFCNAKLSEIRILLNCLDRYGKWFGKIISVKKSGIFCSKGVRLDFLRQFKDQWGFKKLRHGTKYLGVPLFLSNNKARDFAYVKEKIDARLASWKSKSLSWAGRATLIKLVAQTIPNYTMPTFLLPRKINDKLDAAVRRFWWKPKEDSNQFFTLVAWDDLCRLKDEDAKYKVRADWLRAPKASNASWVWKGSGWNDNLLNELFDQESVVAIKSIPIWSFGNNISSSVSLTRKIWMASIHERLKMHLWRIAFNLLPTKDQFSEFSPSSNTNCPLCNVEAESTLHLFTQCHIAKAIWFGSQWNLRIDRWQVQSPAHLIELFIDPPPSIQLDKEQRDEFLLFGALTLDMIWMWRNKAINERSLPVEGQVIRSLQKLFLEHWRPKVPVLTRFPTRSSARWCCPNQESDRKVCIDAIKGGGNLIPWRLLNFVDSVKNVITDYSHVSFNWVHREANQAAHVLANWSLNQYLFGSFDLGFGTPSFVNIILAEAS